MKDFRLILISFCTNALFILPFFGLLVDGQSELSKHPLPLQIDSSSSLSSLSAHSARGRSWHVKKKNIRQNQSPPPTIDPVTVIGERRVRSILKNQGTGNAEDISAWLSTLGADGKWPDVEIDYTTGCEARRAHWPAQDHWKRIVTLAAAWHSGLNGTEQYAQDEMLKSGIYLAMDYWFNRDFPDTACLASGGKLDCPCENPDGFIWNSNWFSNVILIPQFVGEACLLLNDTLSETQRQSFVRMAKRSYEYKVGSMTGANALDIARIGMDQALLTGDVALLADAYARSHKALVIADHARADGIRADGAFGQHDGLLYNGKYGSDFINQILGFETEAEGSDFAANDTSQAAFGNLIEGARWMIIHNTATGVLHWDFSALGRFISFPVADKQATGIKIDLKSVGDLGESWNSKPLLDFESSLLKESASANAGNLVGNRMFYTNDYMVHRGQNYVTTVKLWSARTRHTECINSQSPLGFHLADGTTYTYIRGNEYEDIAAAWDWNRIPGITTDYGATPLNCNNTGLLGIEDFVGGVSDGKIGIAAMRYTNPVTKAFHFQKAWFFLNDDVQHVMVSGVFSTNAETPAISVLDQRRLIEPNVHGSLLGA
ncbi:Chondroitinase-AC [Hypsizygus marmoreus]|uniref:Chondroitinase-AC n=1 Tax=Hypsizygus marmoreus TaxID=39966 RepID=A0A369JFA5_HYPMA|nr:Chondroitinase-AC [Hypsizygus marmoreus]